MRGMGGVVRGGLLAGGLVASVIGSVGPVAAAAVVALGASNTYGKGVARGQDYPARLQALLKAAGVAAKVRNAGINGDTTEGMAARLPRVIEGDTRVLLLQPGGNDTRVGVSADRSEASLEAIRAEASRRGITVVMVPNSMLRGLPHQADGRHLTPEGYDGLARALLSEVLAALGR